MSEKMVWDVLADAEQMMTDDWMSGDSKLFCGEKDYLGAIKPIVAIRYRLKKRYFDRRSDVEENNEWQ